MLWRYDTAAGKVQRKAVALPKGERAGISDLDKVFVAGQAGWENDAQGNSIGGWGFFLAPRDMAKLGYLYLHEGQWDGKQVVSKEWVKAATQKQVTTEGEGGYGYQWWVFPEMGGYAALGLYGQTVFVAPEQDLIVVTTAGAQNHDEIFRLIEDYILKAVQTP